jgi:hypothetical protein
MPLRESSAPSLSVPDVLCVQMVPLVRNFKLSMDAGGDFGIVQWITRMLSTIAIFTEPWQAHLFRLRLEADGIFATVAHEHHVTLNWPWALALGGAKVQVRHADRDRALAVETRARAGEFVAELEAELGPLDDRHCPR